jgi:hypothetical protein
MKPLLREALPPDTQLNGPARIFKLSATVRRSFPIGDLKDVEIRVLNLHRPRELVAECFPRELNDLSSVRLRLRNDEQETPTARKHRSHSFALLPGCLNNNWRINSEQFPSRGFIGGRRGGRGQAWTSCPYLAKSLASPSSRWFKPSFRPAGARGEF